MGLAVVAALTWVHRRSETVGDGRDRRRVERGRLAGVSLLACETAFLVAAGAPLWTSSSTPFASTPAVVALKSAVGSSVVGLGGSLCFLPPGLGIPENAQVAYGVQELALYDPMIPSAYYSSWRARQPRVAGYTRRLGVLPRHQHGRAGPALRGLVRAGASRLAGTQGERLRQRRGGRGPLPDPRCGARDPDPVGGRRATAGRRRSRDARDR